MDPRHLAPSHRTCAACFCVVCGHHERLAVTSIVWNLTWPCSDCADPLLSNSLLLADARDRGDGKCLLSLFLLANFTALSREIVIFLSNILSKTILSSPTINLSLSTTSSHISRPFSESLHTTFCSSRCSLKMLIE